MNRKLSLIMVKPDAIQRGLVEEIEQRLNQRGLKVIRRKAVEVDKKIILSLWPGIFRQTTLERSLDYLGGSPLPVWLVTGIDAALECLRVKTEMRKEYCTDKLLTLFHCPDTDVDFEREYKIFFQDEPIPELS